MVKYNLPDHYVDYYPKFIEFFEMYYQWSTKHGKTPDEMVEILGKDLTFDQLMERMARKNPLNEHDDFHDDYLLRRRSEIFTTSDGYVFAAADDDVGFNRDLYTTNDDSLHQKLWYDTFNFPLIQDEYIQDFVYFLDSSLKPFQDSAERYFLIASSTLYGRYRQLDHNLFIKLLMSLYDIKGTEKCLYLFFNIFFGESVTIEYPKEKLATIDTMMVVDGSSVIRDDDVYQEYSIIVKVSGETTDYDYLFNKIYLPIFHPAGFRIKLEQTT